MKRPKSDCERLEMFQDWGAEITALLTIKQHLGIPKEATYREAKIAIEQWAYEVVGMGREKPRFTPLELLTRARLKGLLPDAGPETATAPDNRARIEEFLARVQRVTGRKIHRQDIWRVAGYKSRTDFEQWQRNDPKTTEAARLTFDRVLAMTPEAFLKAL